MDADFDASETTASRKCVISSNLTSTVDLYWISFALLKNLFEDVAGADGRTQYLVGLTIRILEFCQEMEDLVCGDDQNAASGHRLAVSLERGMQHFDVSAADVVALLKSACSETDYDRLSGRLMGFGERFLRNLPGQIPEAQGPLGQGQVLRAMRNWSGIAAKTGDDLTFLAERFREL